jgi:hypothetical protein
MPASCHDDRPPLLSRSAENGRQRLPEPTAPPWVNGTAPLPAFYRPIFSGRTERGSSLKAAIACAGLMFIGAVLPIAPSEEDED